MRPGVKIVLGFNGRSGKSLKETKWRKGIKRRKDRR